MGEHETGSRIEADTTGLTAPGVWVAGNATGVSAQVVVTAGTGRRAGAQLNRDLVREDSRPAPVGVRGPPPAGQRARAVL